MGDRTRNLGWFAIGLAGAVALTSGSIVLIPREGAAAVVWPPNAALLAALLLIARDRRLELSAGAIAGSILAFVGFDTPLLIATVMAVASCGSALVAAYAIDVIGRRYDGESLLASVSGVGVLIAGVSCGAIAGALVGGPASAVLHDAATLTTIGGWVFGNLAAFVLFTPALLIAGEELRSREHSSLDSRRLIEVALVIAGAAVSATLLFIVAGTNRIVDLPFACLPFVVWSALRLPPWVTWTVVVGLCSAAFAGTESGIGPFANPVLNPSEQNLQLQVFAAVVSLSALIAGALNAERSRLLAWTERSRRFSAALLESVGEGVVAMDEDGRLTVFNREARRIHNVADVPLEDLDADRDSWRARYERYDSTGLTALRHTDLPIHRALNGDSVRNHELRITPPGETARDVKVSAEPITDDDGHPMGAVVALGDETKQRAKERQIASERHQLSEAQEIAGVGSWEWDIAGGAIVWSAQQYRNHFLEPAEGPFTVSLHMPTIHADDRPAIERLLAGLAESPRSFRDDYRTVSQYGDVHYLEIQGRADIGEDGSTLMRGTTRDVTAERIAELERNEAEERFRRAFEDSAAGMALVATAPGQEGRFIDANQAICQIADRTRAEICATDLWSLLHPDDIDRVRAAIDELIAGSSRTYGGEHRLIASGGRMHWIGLDISLVTTAREGSGHAVVQIHDVTERKQFEGQLQYMADHDPLTGLYNRRRFEQELERQIAEAARYDTSGAVLVLDIDNFKYINDSLGHGTGDELLKRTSRSLRSRLRSSDVIARLGGDEFGVILPHATPQEARIVAAELVEVVRGQAHVDSGGVTRRATASIGVSLFGDRGDGPPPSGDDLVVEADVAMYAAKEAGRDGFSIFDPTDESRDLMQDRMQWVERIREALEHDRFCLHAQRIVSLGEDDGRARHELLVRMLDHAGNLIPPGSFLPIAERFDLIRSIDRWVIEHGISLLAREQRRGNDVVFEINLSASSLGDLSLPGLIADVVARTGADPRGLVFEITETEAIVNVASAKAFADELMAIGCGFALDDFGAGFASFYYLKHLSFDYLKIDGEFVKELASSHTDQMVVRAVVDIAQGLGKRTVAEFVGDQPTLELLRELGVDYAQGYHIGKPCPTDEIDLAYAEPVTS
ncbi:EAL domain-containing protein [Thermoleophilia bacterium SCSIO 60948]|nr:EAL domain-containing protein [Thermoleophilia bacterium SCSIO 60948]